MLKFKHFISKVNCKNRLSLHLILFIQINKLGYQKQHNYGVILKTAGGALLFCFEKFMTPSPCLCFSSGQGERWSPFHIYTQAGYWPSRGTEPEFVNV